MDGRSARYSALFLFVPAMYGLNLVIAKDVLESVPPYALIFVTHGIGALLLLASRPFLGSPKIRRRDAARGIPVGLMIFLASALQFTGLADTTPARGALLTILYVVIIPIAAMFARRKASARPLLFGLMSLAGVAILSGAIGDGAPLSGGDALVAAGAVFWALQFLLLERYSPSMDPVNFTAVQLAAATALSLAATLALEPGIHPAPASGSAWWIGLAFMGAVTIGLCFFIQTHVQSKIPASVASVLCCTESVFALAISALTGGDEITLALVAGAAVVTAAAALSAAFGQEGLIGGERG
ncbi:MAG: DMT family transporter [Candidatus Methanoplasma sp.]|jgi:drug/metabolite transporter (DMT)-like permease|nr:DMT family transporter [Candidatus Methanoplasma sp.]